MAKYKVIVTAKDSKCPLVKQGDKFVIRGTMLDMRETDSLCTVALGAINYSLYMMANADDPKSYGRDEVYCLQCPDPETRVIFEVSRRPMD
ncbi:MAG: TIGR04076 family protein [Proteobacteria bacterium]|nr:TIGR04076 family protein [Pseudomonadota bacterium]